MKYAACFALCALVSLIVTMLLGAAGVLTLYLLVFGFTLSCLYAFVACIAALIAVWTERDQ